MFIRRRVTSIIWCKPEVQSLVAGQTLETSDLFVLFFCLKKTLLGPIRTNRSLSTNKPTSKAPAEAGTPWLDPRAQASRLDRRSR